MKKLFLGILLFAAFMSTYAQTQVSLDKAIQSAEWQIQAGLNKGATIVVYQFQSPGERLSDYVLKELFNMLVNSKNFTVLDRTAQEVIDAEIDFQYGKSAGMISDESLASLTKRIGAQAIITGSLDDTANEYRFRIRIIGTETTAVIASYAVSVNKNDKKIAGLLSRQKRAGEKIGIGVMNIALGLGSYIEGDIAGGLTISGGYAIAAGLFLTEAFALDWNSPAVGIPGTIGIAAGCVTLVYGFARPFIFNRSPGVANVLGNMQIEIVQMPDVSGNNTSVAKLSYTIKF